MTKNQKSKQRRSSATTSSCKENSNIFAVPKSKVGKQISKKKDKKLRQSQQVFTEQTCHSNLTELDRVFLSEKPFQVIESVKQTSTASNRKKPLKKQSGKKSYKASIRPVREAGRENTPDSEGDQTDIEEVEIAQNYLRVQLLEVVSEHLISKLMRLKQGQGVQSRL